MHQNPVFRGTAEAANIAFARERAFGVLTAATAEGPLLAHVPFVLNEAGDALECHLMRSNPLARALGQGVVLGSVCLAVSGPDAYVSPDWYEIGLDQVPTWNYVAVHLSGRVELLPETALRPHLDAVSAHMEGQLAALPPHKTPWRVDKMPAEAYARLARQLVPVRLTIETVASTWKLNQNKPVEAQARAAEAISATAGHTDAGAYALGQSAEQIADLMRRAVDGRTPGG
ncbi:MAG: FMN-binding negative transcriptional regulator [Pseudomonadota bacterium]